MAKMNYERRIKLSKEFDQEKHYLGIELGSTRIKAVLINDDFETVASGSFDWENDFVDGIWTFDLKDAWIGLQKAYKELSDNIFNEFGVQLRKVGSIGISGMMHGYLPFDSEGNLLSRFKTWRNADTDDAVVRLSELFQFNIPHRWSVSHLYKAMLDNENHVKDIDYMSTLSSYIHWRVTGEQVIGVGEASGMFPINSQSSDYDDEMVSKFDGLIKEKGYPWTFRDIFPKVLSAGEYAGELTEEGAKLIDPTGNLQASIPLAPPESDAGTGMVATNSVKKNTGNISAGTSIFSMTVLENELSDYYEEVDMVTTPHGNPVAMIHCNNFTTDINQWVDMFSEVVELSGHKVEKDKLFTLLFEKALKSDNDLGKMMSFNYFAGEPITDTTEGRPLFVRTPDSNLTLANFMNEKINSSLATLRIGIDILIEKEGMPVNYFIGHGGFFKTKYVGQQLMADALETPISVMETATEGGPWGMAVLAAYSASEKNLTLDKYLDDQVFSKIELSTVKPTEQGIKKYRRYLDKYKQALEVEKSAIEHIN